MMKVLERNAGIAPGEQEDRFHLQNASTHAAIVDKLRHTGGYLMVAASEGGPLLCPSWPSSGTWNQATHVNLQRMLDSAYGGLVPWETAVERRAYLKRVSESLGHRAPVAADDTTNVVLLLLQQPSVFANWWAQSESRCSIGLAGRFLFGFGTALPPGPTRWAEFGSQVAVPFVEAVFEKILRELGPAAPVAPSSSILSWPASAAAAEFVREFRVMCFDVARASAMGDSFVSGLNKTAYWLSVAASLSTMVAQAIEATGPSPARSGFTPELCDAAVRCSVDFYCRRVMFGLAALDVDIQRRAWARRPVRRADQHSPIPATAIALLRATGGPVLTARLALGATPALRQVLESSVAGARAASLC